MLSDRPEWYALLGDRFADNRRGVDDAETSTLRALRESQRRVSASLGIPEHLAKFIAVRDVSEALADIARDAPTSVLLYRGLRGTAAELSVLLPAYVLRLASWRRGLSVYVRGADGCPDQSPIISPEAS